MKYQRMQQKTILIEEWKNNYENTKKSICMLE